MRSARESLAALAALLSHAEAQWAARPHWEMKPCAAFPQEANYQPGNASLLDPDCHFLPGWKDASTGSYGGPFRDSVDLEWNPSWVRSLESGKEANEALFEAITTGKIRIGVDTSNLKGGMDLTMPLSGSRKVNGGWDAPAMRKEYLSIVDPEDPDYNKEGGPGSFKPGSDISSISSKEYFFSDALRSKGFPMCPNYWDATGGEDVGGGPMNRDSMKKQLGDEQDSLFYKFPNKKVGSPLIGDPELSFCRKWQEKYDATCCLTYLDEDIQEEYEELAGGGYLGAHVFLQQFLCLPCHPMISCMIDEETDTLKIPFEFAKRLADEIDDFDRTGLKVKVGEQEPDRGPIRQDELYIPSDYFATWRGTGGGPAPPFPAPNDCGERNGDETNPWQVSDADTDPPTSPPDAPHCVVIAQEESCPFPGGGGECEADPPALAQYPAADDGQCSCTGPGKDCACIREFLLHNRPPGINGYDGLDLNIEIVAGDQCNVLFDLMAGALPHPRASAGLRAGPRDLLFTAGVALLGVLTGR